MPVVFRLLETNTAASVPPRDPVALVKCLDSTFLKKLTSPSKKNQKKKTTPKQTNTPHVNPLHQVTQTFWYMRYILLMLTTVQSIVTGATPEGLVMLGVSSTSEWVGKTEEWFTEPGYH